jgi:hypothetical protein
MMAGSMRRNRALALAGVAALLGLLRWLAPASTERAAWLYLIVLPLGYGHVVGAAVSASSRRSGPVPPCLSRVLTAAFAGSCLLTLFAAYAWALRSPALQPLVLAPILLQIAWHKAENDLELGRAYASGMRFGALRRTLRPHAITLALAAGAGGVALSTPEGALFARFYFGRSLVPLQPWLTLDDLSAAFVLYHTLSWLLYLEDRARTLARSCATEAVRLRRRVLAFHAAPLALAAALQVWLPGAQVYLAAPGLYVFWSALHTVHTAVARGLDPRAAAA